VTIEWIGLLICGWLAATVSGFVGFGGALLLLPVLALVVGPKAAVPILTIAQLLGNLSRAGFGWRDIRWRPSLEFGAGAIPASIAGSRLFADLPAGRVGQVIGCCLLGLVAWRHTKLGKRDLPAWFLIPAGAGVGFLSALAGSAGPLGAAVFLSLNLPARSYIASEATAAVIIHLSKSMIYGRYSLLNRLELLSGLALGVSMILGSWTGRKLVERIEGKRFVLLVECLLVVSGVSLLFTPA